MEVCDIPEPVILVQEEDEVLKLVVTFSNVYVPLSTSTVLPSHTPERTSRLVPAWLPWLLNHH